MAHLPMGEVVYKSEHGNPRVGDVTGGISDAKSHLAGQMYTDAVFNSDIRVIQTIINRIDGGLPKDVDIEVYQTLFGDCMNEVLEMTSNTQLKVLPTDSVMMALCKSLYDIASADIYHEIKNDKHGNKWSKQIKPSTEARQAKDSALRLVLERAGGRKTATAAKGKELGKVTVADWITRSLPRGEHDDATG